MDVARNSRQNSGFINFAETTNKYINEKHLMDNNSWRIISVLGTLHFRYQITRDGVYFTIFVQKKYLKISDEFFDW